MFSVLAVPVLIFGDRFEEVLNGEKALTFLRSLGSWSGVIGIVMIMADLVLPLPSHSIMAGLGLIYGALTGGILAGIGSYSAGLLAYVLCRLFGQRAAIFIAGQDEIDRISEFFLRHGVWAIALSRWAPVLPEILSCLAGLTRMPFWRFSFGNMVGSLAVGFAYAYFGSQGEDNPGGAILIAVFAPFLALPLFLLMLSPRKDKGDE